MATLKATGPPTIPAIYAYLYPSHSYFTFIRAETIAINVPTSIQVYKNLYLSRGYTFTYTFIRTEAMAIHVPISQPKLQLYIQVPIYELKLQLYIGYTYCTYIRHSELKLYLYLYPKYPSLITCRLFIACKKERERDRLRMVSIMINNSRQRKVYSKVSFFKVLLSVMIWPSFEYIKQHREGREPWSSGYGRILMFQRSWVQIPAPYSGWT